MRCYLQNVLSYELNLFPSVPVKDETVEMDEYRLINIGSQVEI